MDIRLKRLLCMLLVISMILTMPACGSIDGRPASFLEVVFYAVTALIQGAALVVGELIIAGIFFLLDLAINPIDDAIGEKDRWVVEDAVAPVAEWYGRLIDPKGRFIDWELQNADEKDPNKIYADGKIEEKVISSSGAYGVPEGTESNLLSDLMECDHTPYRYYEGKNVIRCKCGANDFTWWDHKDYWNYNTFSECVKGIVHFLRSNEKKQEYCVDHYMLFGGVNRVMLNLEDYLALPYISEDQLEKWNKAIDFLEDVNAWDKVYGTFEDSVEKMDERCEYNKVFSDSLTVLKALLQTRQMIEDTGDPVAACEHFIDLTGTLMGTVGDYTGKAGTFLLVGLELLWPVLQAYEMGMADHIGDLTVTELTKYAQVTYNWKDLAERAVNDKTGEYIFWERYITFEHILGTKVVYYIEHTGQKIEMPPGTGDFYGDYRRLCLPDLKEAVEAYSIMDEKGRAFLAPYIMFCMDEIFEELMGIGYTDYVEYLHRNSK